MFSNTPNNYEYIKHSSYPQIADILKFYDFKLLSYNDSTKHMDCNLAIQFMNSYSLAKDFCGFLLRTASKYSEVYYHLESPFTSKVESILQVAGILQENGQLQIFSSYDNSAFIIKYHNNNYISKLPVIAYLSNVSNISETIYNPTLIKEGIIYKFDSLFRIEKTVYGIINPVSYGLERQYSFHDKQVNRYIKKFIRLNKIIPTIMLVSPYAYTKLKMMCPYEYEKNILSMVDLIKNELLF